MAIGLIEIVNDALATLGEQPIVDLKKEHATSTSILINQKYPLVQRTLLMEDDWNCARITTQLPKVKATTNRGYKYTFRLPVSPECLGIRQISLDNGETFIDLNAYYNMNAGPKEALFDIDQDYLLCNAETVWIKYTGLIDPASFDPFLASAFSARLAAELAYAIPASTSLAQYLDQIANKKLKKAKSRNALTRNIINPDGEVLGSRYGGSSDRYLRVDMSEEME
jgi:hypothetical protein